MPKLSVKFLGAETVLAVKSTVIPATIPLGVQNSDDCNMSSNFSQKLDIQMILQLSGCLSATNTCKHNTFSTCDFYIYATQQSFKQGKSLNLNKDM